MGIEVIDEAEQRRFVVSDEDGPAGVLEYRIDPEANAIVLVHTIIAPEKQGLGLAGALVRGALDAIRATTDYAVVAKCPYAAGWIDKHPEYQDLLQR